MHNFLYRIIPWTIILAPFLILGLSYNSLPADIMIFRHLDGTADYAPKSLFTVFRVPLIEVVCGLAIVLMRRRAAGVSEYEGYYLMWTVLLWTVAAKTFLQMLDLLSPEHRAEQFFYVTGIVVIMGIILAGVAGRKTFGGFKRAEWKLELWEKTALTGLLISYLFLAFAPQV
jgi:hypothetical protein